MIRNFLLACLFMIVIPQSVGAATFCVAGNGIALQCLYDDAALCRREADRSSSLGCTINPDALLTYSGGSPYCVVGSDLQAECIYSDRSQCSNVADRRRAVCIEQDSRAGDENNPYRFDPRVQN